MSTSYFEAIDYVQIIAVFLTAINNCGILIMINKRVIKK